MRTQKRILTIIELGGYPDFSPVYQHLGLLITQTRSMRKALPLIRKLTPDIIVAEFIYRPTYGTQLSNFETLYASIQASSPDTKLVALIQPPDVKNLSRVNNQVSPSACLRYPVTTTDMQRCLENILSTNTPS